MQPPDATTLPAELLAAVARLGMPLTPHLFAVRISTQTATLFESAGDGPRLLRTIPCSTSRFGIGQIKDSNQTPLGLHRIAEKIGDGEPIGMVFKARRPVGMEITGNPTTAITTRILWLEGLEPGLNRGGDVDTHDRYIYIHGTGDETKLGRPASCGCIHLAAADLIPLFDLLPSGTLVWIEKD